jgi:GGDEF domain-containing protein
VVYLYDQIVKLNPNNPKSEVVILINNTDSQQKIKELENTVNLLSVCLAMQQSNQFETDSKTIDSLTGLHWRTEKRREEETKGTAYAMIDLRKLHEQNRKYGHEIVDEQGFKPFGRYMKENFREDDRVTRTIGQSDEFQVVAYGCSSTELDNKLADMQKYYKNNDIGIVQWDYAVGDTIAQADMNLINVKAKRNPLRYALMKAKELFFSTKRQPSKRYTGSLQEIAEDSYI